MKEIKVTVLVAIYNAEKYLMECLESLINQSLKEIEIICINDGSTDNSQIILEKYGRHHGTYIHGMGAAMMKMVLQYLCLARKVSPILD